MRTVLLPLVAAVSMALALPVQAAEMSRYIVKFKQGQAEQARSGIHAAGGEMLLDLSRHNAAAFMLPASAMSGLMHNPNIEYVEADVPRYPMAQTIPYGIPMVQADEVSDDDAGLLTVCIIDSGIDRQHEDLNANHLTGTNDAGTGNWFTDENSHGTHVAGTIAALDNDDGVIGVNPNGRLNIHIIKVFDASGWAYSSSLVAALDKCDDAGAVVVNMSLGGPLKSRTEDRAFADAENRGILSVAAAGNDGNTRHSYPASYSAVVSVAAIDSAKVVADFSQRTSQVELAGPGVGVLSTVPMGAAQLASVTIDGGAVSAVAMEGSVQASVSGNLVNCGLAETPCAANGQVCLISRGNISFAEKVLNCQTGGGVGAIIYNNVAGDLLGTLGGVQTAIPSVGVSDTTGADLLAKQGQLADVTVAADHYAYFSGTSMATPHVAGVAALVWSQHLNCSNKEIRAVLRATAEDLGPVGRDDAYGYGLVQAKAASDYIYANGCTVSGGGGGGSDTCKGKRCK
ncbi:S8 family serine peptidase [Shewanella sp.]|uniref:S8 family serine peptidase n=1 Tax=Shewanella sp. TaxID=50422 RepID=UPI003567F824